MSVSYKWVSCNTSLLPHGFPMGAIPAGSDIDGSAIYIGRSFHEGDVLPAKVIPAKNACYVAHNGVEVFKEEFEVMVFLTLLWKPSSKGSVPQGAVAAGNTAGGETLYIGRVVHNGCTTLGKVHPSHGTCYFPFGGEELRSENYQCLVIE